MFRDGIRQADDEPVPARLHGLLMRICICLGVLGVCLYLYIDKQNELTHLKIRLPELEKQIRQIREENQRLVYEIDRFENPSRLIELAHHPEYSHLKHPLIKEILTVPEGFAQADSDRRDLW